MLGSENWEDDFDALLHLVHRSRENKNCKVMTHTHSVKSGVSHGKGQGHVPCWCKLCL